MPEITQPQNTTATQQPTPQAPQPTTPMPQQPVAPSSAGVPPKGKSIWARALDQILGKKEKAPSPTVNVNVTADTSQPSQQPTTPPPTQQ